MSNKEKDPFVAELLDLTDALRYTANYRTRDFHDAEDLVQDTLVKALAHRDQYIPGTNMKAWVLTILYNDFVSKGRKVMSRATVYVGTASDSCDATIEPPQEDSLFLRQIVQKMDTLPPHMQQALLQAIYGFSYEETSDQEGIAVGTVKSRLYRAREELSKFA